MPKYVKLKELREKGFIDEDPPLLPFLQVDQSMPQWTGLFDFDGEPICRLPYPIGFGRDDEW